MSGFWDLSTGESAKDTGTDFEIPSGNMEPIPDGSSLLAVIDEAKWTSDKDANRYISLRWSVLKPEDYANRKVFQKLWVTDLDPSAKDEAKGKAKRDKARKMLAAIDGNAGGKLAAKQSEPNDDALGMALLNKPMVITVKLWEIDDRSTGDKITGNWVCAVGPKSKELDIKATKPAAKRQDDGFGTSSGTSRGRDLDDEIPF